MYEISNLISLNLSVPAAIQCQLKAMQSFEVD